ncbi:MAG: hypothetical protein R6U88_05185 [Candidatus Bipolaricaulota bacterium]
MRLSNWIGGGALLVVVGLLAALLVVLVNVLDGGIELRVAGQVEVTGALEPQEANVTLEIPEPVLVELSEGVDVQAQVERMPGTWSELGVLLPARWNLLTGELEWRYVDGEDAEEPG